VTGSGADASVEFTAEHAVPVHERTDVRHPIGEAKFLENALKEEQQALLEAIAAELRRALT
jgi:hypothetical protein